MENFTSVSNFFIPLGDYDGRIEFGIYNNIPENENLKLVAYDVATGMNISTLNLNGYTKTTDGFYWWVLPPGNEPVPEKLNLGDVILHLVYNNKVTREFYLNRGGLGKKLLIQGQEIRYPKSAVAIYPTFWEIFINHEYDLINDIILNEQSIVVDVGCNYGLFSLYVIDRYNPKKVIAIEPNYECFSVAKEMLGNISSFICFNYAITNSIGKYRLENHTLTSAAGTTIEDYEGDIQGIDINTFLEGLNEDVIDLLKIDCEGCELTMFETISENNIKKIKNMVIEYHSEEIKDVILTKLHEFGFDSDISLKMGIFGIILAKNLNFN